MKLLVLAAVVASCVAAPHPNLPAVVKIPQPGVNLVTPVVKSAPVVVKSAPVVVKSAPVAVVKAAAVVAPAVPATVVAAPEPLMAPEPPMPSLNVPHMSGKFHAQDEAGQYSFGHWGGPNTQVEMKDSFGRVLGSFAYVDPEGDVQVRKYAAAPGSGFRVAASDLPEDTPEVAGVKAVLTNPQ